MSAPLPPPPSPTSFFRYLLLLLGLCLLAWGVLLVKQLILPSSEFVYPKNKDLTLHITGSLHYKQEGIQSHLEPKKYRYEAFLKGKLASASTPSYRFLWEKFQLFEGKELLFSYEELSSQQSHYQSSPRLSPSHRKKIFDFFGLTTENHDANQDHSLFKKPFIWTFSPQGGLGSLRLPTTLRRSLLKITEGSLVQPLVSEWIDHSQDLVKLAPPQWFYKKWRSRGYFFTPLQWQHRYIDKQSYHSLGRPKKIKNGCPSFFTRPQAAG